MDSYNSKLPTAKRGLPQIAGAFKEASEFTRLSTSCVGISTPKLIIKGIKPLLISAGSFNISTAKGLIQGISHKYCKHIHKKDGYGYIG